MQNDVIRQVREKEEEIENKVREAAAEAADRLRTLTAENELRIRQTKDALETTRREHTERMTAEAAEREAAALEQARKDADTLRKNAMVNMDAAKAIVTETVLRRV